MNNGVHVQGPDRVLDQKIDKPGGGFHILIQLCDACCGLLNDFLGGISHFIKRLPHCLQRLLISALPFRSLRFELPLSTPEPSQELTLRGL